MLLPTLFTLVILVATVSISDVASVKSAATVLTAAMFAPTVLIELFPEPVLIASVTRPKSSENVTCPATVLIAWIVEALGVIA